MHIGVVCYASVGGSGIVATELAKSLARRGHQVHLISTEPPFRLGDYEAGLAFHRVHTPTYPLFREPQYLLSLANKIVQLSREFSLDIVHAHYAIPHATAAYLAKQIIASTNGRSDAKVPKVITTLHGTDITLLGSDPSYSETVAFSIDQSDGVTAVSDSLRQDTYQSLSLKHEIRVIPNFLECDEHGRRDLPDLRARLCPPAKYDKLIIHLSNFRPVKRVDAVVEIFERIRKDVRAKLIFVGEGPELGRAMRMVHDRGLACDVEALGEQDQVVPLLVGLGSVPAAVGPGEFRSRRARSDGVRGAGRGVARRRPAGGGRGRRVRIPARPRRHRGHGEGGDLAAERSCRAQALRESGARSRAAPLLRRPRRSSVRSVLSGSYPELMR